MPAWEAEESALEDINENRVGASKIIPKPVFEGNMMLKEGGNGIWKKGWKIVP